MEYSKQQKLNLKEDIKKLAAEQKSLRPQRKTVHFTGTRTLDPWQACYKLASNRYRLRHLYITYGFMRGKSIDQIEPKRKTDFDQKYVDKLLTQYGTEAVHADA